ncbi:energy-coupling factor transport system ATP-binding protein [Lentibacillus halodurans]|uniref:Energy-coupling factor transport system ATP-binding protein n=1 Tax=Lentibacillus halodurans TaxID=237679 RepID=A0A1I0YKM1_9BACI|nr:ABC transporter ATP-binding protein [Lentibacillus halodurans]SFB12713.1 energy-coupling factor transport system ATP-binding protein [Lentibacillus halodurans]
MNIIDVEGLKYKYPDTDKLALNDVSFKVEKGEFIGLIGRNTAGKSSLCFALSGLVPHFFKGAYGGKVLVDGMEIKQHEIGEIAAKVGLVFENPFSQMTGSKYSVYEEIAFGLENMGIERKEMIARIDESLELLAIKEMKDQNPFDLSGGQMQRVAIASVIAMRPDVLILDEPTSQLDPQGSAEVFRVVENLTKEGMTIIMAEHKMEKISQYADSVLLLDDGELIDYDTPENVFSRDDLINHGIAAPMVTSVAKAMGMKKSDTGKYPVTLSEISREMGDQR